MPRHLLSAPLLLSVIIFVSLELPDTFSEALYRCISITEITAWYHRFLASTSTPLGTPQNTHEPFRKSFMTYSTRLQASQLRETFD
jgi:hypothetical protein